MAVREQIRFGGSNTLVNSFDSSDPLYSIDKSRRLRSCQGDGPWRYCGLHGNHKHGRFRRLSIYGKVVIGPGGSVWWGRTDLLAARAWHSSSTLGMSTAAGTNTI